MIIFEGLHDKINYTFDELGRAVQDQFPGPQTPSERKRLILQRVILFMAVVRKYEIFPHVQRKQSVQ